MPSLTIDNGRTDFFYLDSGRPKAEVYTTLVILHGHTFHGGIFQRVLPLAADKELRLICLNRRDYTGTTLYSSADLELLTTGDEIGRAAFLEARGREVALFLHRVIERLCLPAPDANGKAGGIALMGWSLGNVEPIALVAGVSSLPLEVRTRVQLYLRKLILHDPPSLALGIKSPPKQYIPLNDESIPQDKRGTAFAHWVSSYFTHGKLSLRDLNTLAYKNPDPSRKSSIARMSTQEFESVVDFGPGTRSETYLHTRFESDLFQQTCKALFDPMTRASWPGLTIWLVNGDSAPWHMIYAAWEVERIEKTSHTQKLSFLVMRNANHFVFWDEPEKALDAYVYCLRH